MLIVLCINDINCIKLFSDLQPAHLCLETSWFALCWGGKLAE